MMGRGAVVAVRTAFDSPWMTVRETIIERDHRVTSWYYVDHPGCALVLPITVDGQVALVKAWRVSVARWCLEAPAGRIEPDEDPAAAARRELREEVGGECGNLHKLGSVLASSGSSNERVHLFVATDVRLGPSAPDPDEHLELNLVAQRRALELAQSGGIEDGPSALAVLWAYGRGLLDGGPDR